MKREPVKIMEQNWFDLVMEDDGSVIDDWIIVWWRTRKKEEKKIKLGAGGAFKFVTIRGKYNIKLLIVEWIIKQK